MVKVNDKIEQTMVGLKLDMQHDPDFVFKKKKKKKRRRKEKNIKKINICINMQNIFKN